MKQTPRAAALRIIEKVLASRRLTVKEQLSDAFSAHALSSRDKTLVTELAYGVVRHLNTLDWHIDRSSDFGDIKRSIRYILRLGAYQLLYLDKVPAYAAISESVQMAKKVSVKSAGFVNAVLRKISLNKQEILTAGMFPDRVRYLSVKYSFPEWMVRKWQGTLSGEALEAFCAASDERPCLSIRVNTLLITPEQFKKLLAEKGIEHTQGSHPLVFRLRSAVSSDDLGGLFAKGYFFVQDESTVRVVDLLGPRPGEQVLDLCAAPGGKSTYIAQLMQDRGMVAAVDSNPKRGMMLKENIERLRASIVRPYTADILRLREPGGIREFDKVLLDAPCSNQGVLAKRVEARWRLRPEDIPRLAELQLRMLGAAARFVKPAGALVYSTCSVDRDEDEAVVERFLRSHKNYSFEKMFKTWPHSDKIDGAFAARFIRAT